MEIISSGCFLCVDREIFCEIIEFRSRRLFSNHEKYKEIQKSWYNGNKESRRKSRGNNFRIVCLRI